MLEREWKTSFRNSQIYYEGSLGDELKQAGINYYLVGIIMSNIQVESEDLRMATTTSSAQLIVLEE